LIPSGPGGGRKMGPVGRKTSNRSLLSAIAGEKDGILATEDLRLEKGGGEGPRRACG